MRFNFVLVIVIIADDVLKTIRLPATRTVWLTEDQGLADVRMMIRNGTIQNKGELLVILVSGRAEVEAEHPAGLNTAWATMLEIACLWPVARVLVSAPVPRSGDKKFLLNGLHSFSKGLRQLCRRNSRFEFARLGYLFFNKHGLDHSLYQQGVISETGVSLFTSQLREKILSSKCISRAVWEPLEVQLTAIEEQSR